jgi:Hemerythrin HHE cation binding domain
MSTSDPVLYPQPAGTTEGLRQEAARARDDVAQTIELLAERMTPSRVLRSSVTVPVVAAVVAGVGTWVTMLRSRVVREIAWVGGLTAATVAFAAARRVVAPRGPAAALREPELRTPAVRTGLNDVVDVLLDQHREILAAFDRVRDAAAGQDRLEVFAALVQLLRHHERVEQRVVHPELAAFADEVARARVEEENAANRMLASLISIGVTDKTFDSGFARLRQMVVDHAAHEETEEFPLLRERIPAGRRRQLAGEVFRSP